MQIGVLIYAIKQILIMNNGEKINFFKLNRDDQNKYIGCACDFLFEVGNLKESYDLVYCVFPLRNGDIFFEESTPQICVKNDKVIEYSNLIIV